MRNLDCTDGTLGKPGSRKRFGIGRKDTAQATELGNEAFGERLRVATGKGQTEQIFDQLVIMQRIWTTFDQPFAQSGSMTRSVGGRISIAHSPVNSAQGRHRQSFAGKGHNLDLVAVRVANERGVIIGVIVS